MLIDTWDNAETVILGGVLMAIGHFLMAFQFLFFPALVFLILGNGAFKPNISTQVGNLYTPGDPRRDRAFSIFYLGINAGALLSPLVCGTWESFMDGITGSAQPESEWLQDYQFISLDNLGSRQII